MKRRFGLSLLLLTTLSAQGCARLFGMVDPVRTPALNEVEGAWVGLSTRGAVWRMVLNRDGSNSTDGVALMARDASFPDELERLAVRSWRLDGFDIRIVVDAPRTAAAQTMEWRGTASSVALDLSNGVDRLILQREERFTAGLEQIRAEGD